jgi:hypothetical protein
MLHQQLAEISADVSAIVTSESLHRAGNGAGMPAWALDGLLDSSIKHHKHLKTPFLTGVFILYSI